ncbi:MAG: polysaccharide biosynthesis C-terminal domain-containing protein [Oligoflexia bacterium]|nr:polysaccharide biosynthesis C-terminal domain-containing protein [Oligoflexia bacterium]
MRTQRTLKNYLASVLYTGLTLVVGLVATPLLIRFLGETRLGAFRAMADWFAYLNLLELGLGGALLALLAAAASRNDRPALLRTLATGIRAYLWAALAMVGCGIGLVFLLPGLVKVPPEQVPDLRVGALILLCQFVFVPFIPFRLATEASQRSYRVHAILGAQSLLMTALTVGLAWAGRGIAGQALGTVIAFSLLPLLLAWMWVRTSPGFFTALKNARLATEEGRALGRLNKDVLIFDAAGRVSLFTDNILLAYFLGAGQVVPFIVTTRLAQIAQGLLQNVGNSSWAALAELHAQGESGRFNARVLEITRVIAILAFAILVPIAAFNREFVALWVGEQRFAGNWVGWIAAANALLLALISFWVWCFSGTGKVGRLIPTWIAWALVNLVASIAFTRTLGAVGPLLGTLVSYLAVSVWRTPLMMREVFGTSPRELFRAVAAPLALALPYAALLSWLASVHSPRWWLMLEAGLAAAAFVGLSWFVLLDQAARQVWRQRILPKEGA